MAMFNEADLEPPLYNDFRPGKELHLIDQLTQECSGKIVDELNENYRVFLDSHREPTVLAVRLRAFQLLTTILVQEFTTTLFASGVTEKAGRKEKLREVKTPPNRE